MIAFIKKEIMENIRTKKFLIMIIIFIILGIMSPLFAKLTPDILKMANINAEALNLKDPTAFDSFTQFFKNIGQMGIIILIIMYSGLIANEFNKGTLVNILTKGMKRSGVILSKFIVASLMWIIVYYVSFIISYLYTCYYFDISIISNVLFSNSILGLFGILLISFIIIGGILFKNVVGSLLTPTVFAGIMLLLNIIDKFQRYNPISLSSLNMNILNGTNSPNYLYPAIIISIILIIINIILSIRIFNKMEIK